MMFIWTQSALKDLEKDSTCPSRWKGQWLDKLFKSPTSEAANYGNYFEYLAIGGSAHGDAVTDLPRTLKGEKTAVQRRIDAQAELYKEFVDQYSKQYQGYTITGSQIKLSGLVGGQRVEGTVDILAEDKDGYPVIIDLKLTETIDNTRTEYGWGNATEDLDLLQQILYQELYFQNYGVKPKMVLWVFEHGVQQRVKIINLNISNGKLIDCIERFQTGAEIVELYNDNSWSRIPSEKECGVCQLECAKRFKKQNIIIEDVNY